ncbi:hypothetical protein AC579_2526 [Pseudocercospora musae]|uniref:Uncharacterized protein n=1 Tax=Pseudocercospora musae TaxID=113226 RepID=A0A139I4B1_9PEZI|nr:hypothetical protein AC579_2526 [Pseudocercospora musae]
MAQADMREKNYYDRLALNKNLGFALILSFITSATYVALNTLTTENVQLHYMIRQSQQDNRGGGSRDELYWQKSAVEGGAQEHIRGRDSAECIAEPKLKPPRFPTNLPRCGLRLNVNLVLSPFEQSTTITLTRHNVMSIMTSQQPAGLECNDNSEPVDEVDQRVFDTAELLEEILLEVGITTLLLSCTRADKRFAMAIACSIKLQRVLWFQPTPVSQICNTASRLKPSCPPSRKTRHQSHVPGTQMLKHNEKQGETATNSPHPSSVIRVLSFSNLIDMGRLPRLGSWRKMFPMQNSDANERPLYWKIND